MGFCHTERSEVTQNLKTQIEIFRTHALNMTKKHSVVASNNSTAVIASKTKYLRGDFMGMYILCYVFDCWVCRLSVIMTYYYLA